METTSLFSAALGLSSPWFVDDVRFDPVARRIDFALGYQRGARFPCPHCGAEHQPVHDTQAREWRHLNFFQYEAYLQAKAPRVRCAQCGKTSQIPVPWARPNSGFTQLMEALIVTLCRAMPVAGVARLLRVSDMRVWRVLEPYVDAARAQEDFSSLKDIGLDETAARRGHHYISLFHDMEAERLVFATEGRKAEVVDQFAEDLEAHGGCAENIRSVCIDMSAAYQAGVAEHLPWADITFDAFHVIQLVNKAVDEVRRAEVKTQPGLKRSRYLWLKDKSHWTHRQIGEFANLSRLNLKTHRAWRIKEALREIFRTATSREDAEPLLKSWVSWARRCRLEPMKKVAQTITEHWQGVLNAFDSRLTNGRVEAINGQIQAAKAKARGYGTVKHLITIAYLIAGKLTRLPACPFDAAACATLSA